MTLDVLAPVVLVGVVVVALVYTQVIAPRRHRRAVAATFARRGWSRLDPDGAPGWPEIQALAAERAAGSNRSAEYERNAGPFTERVRRTEQRTGKVLDLYRDESALHARYAAVAIHEERTRSRTVTRTDQHRWVARELWIGEARALPVGAPMVVVRWGMERLRKAAAPMAVARGVDLDDIPQTAPPPGDLCAQEVRALLAETDPGANVRVDIYLAPGAWVLTSPLAPAGSHLEGVLALAERISAAADRWPSTR